MTFARLVNSLAAEETDTPNTTFERVWDAQALWEAFQKWWELRPTRVKPLFNLPPGTANPFPKVIFIDTSSSSSTLLSTLMWSQKRSFEIKAVQMTDLGGTDCAHTFFHAGCILLLTERKHDESDEMVWSVFPTHPCCSDP